MSQQTPSASKLTDPSEILPFINNAVVRDLIASGMMAQGVIEKDERPTWVTKAAQGFLECAMSGGKRKERQSENFRLGHLCSLMKTARPEDFGSERAVAEFIVSNNVDGLIQTELAKEPPTEQADYHAGMANGLRNGLTISGPVILYMLVAIKWREIQKLKNITEFHSWLQQLMGANQTGSRDRIAKFARRIGLRFGDKGGRPASKPRKRLRK